MLCLTIVPNFLIYLIVLRRSSKLCFSMFWLAMDFLLGLRPLVSPVPALWGVLAALLVRCSPALVLRQRGGQPRRLRHHRLHRRHRRHHHPNEPVALRLLLRIIRGVLTVAVAIAIATATATSLHGQ